MTFTVDTTALKYTFSCQSNVFYSAVLILHHVSLSNHPLICI